MTQRDAEFEPTDLVKAKKDTASMYVSAFVPHYNDLNALDICPVARGWAGFSAAAELWQNFCADV